MFKTLLKFFLFELVERIARVDTLLAELECASHPVSPRLIEGFRERLTSIKQELMNQKALLLQLFSDKPSGNADLRQILTQTVLVPYRELTGLTRLLLQVYPQSVLSETYLFLKDACPLELLNSLTSSNLDRHVCLTAEQPPQDFANSWVLTPNQGDSPLLVEGLPILDKMNPLGWVGLNQAYLERLYRASSSLETLKFQSRSTLPSLNGQTPDQAFEAMAKHALGLRLFGPSYYYHTVADALLSERWDFLHLQEPALFYGLNHYNFTDKTLVFLHESIEKARTAFPTEFSAAEPLTDPVMTALNDLFRTAEQLVSGRNAFTEKQFQRSLELQDRLAQGILISGSSLYLREEVSANIDQQMEATNFTGSEASNSIYDLLTLIREEPNAPRDIINAGWIFKVERGPVWLYSTLSAKGLDGFTRLTELLANQDSLLQKSIETSEIHRVLQCQT